MKTQDIKRGITSRHFRLGGSSPAIGSIARLRDTEMLPRGERRSRRRGRSSAVDKRSGSLWLILLGGGTLVVITTAVFLWLMPRFDPEAMEIRSLVAEDAKKVRVASRFPSPSREESLELVRRALTTRDPAAVPELFRTSVATPAEIIGFLEECSLRDGKIERYEWLSSMDRDGLLIEGVLVCFPSKDKAVQRLALLTPNDSGTWKVDFEAFARRVEPGWQELLEKGADQALVRVTVAPGVYYNGPFSDDRQWVCYGIASPDMEELLRGYCRVGSPQAEAMERLFKQGEKLSRATLEIRRVKDGGHGQFEITRLLGGEWVVAGVPGSNG